MDRELLVEIGCEELPAGWLPSLGWGAELIYRTLLGAASDPG